MQQSCCISTCLTRSDRLAGLSIACIRSVLSTGRHGLAIAYTPRHKLARLHVGHIIKGQLSAQAVWTRIMHGSQEGGVEQCNNCVWNRLCKR